MTKAAKTTHSQPTTTARKESSAKKADQELTVDRRKADGRRMGEERRKTSVPVAVERRQGERRKVQRRRQIDPTTCEREYSIEEVEFMNAMDDYKRRSGRMFPTCSEVLEVIRALGYVKQAVAPAVSAEAIVAPSAAQEATAV